VDVTFDKVHDSLGRKPKTGCGDDPERGEISGA
jgi:hypothetical protein